MPLKHKHSMVCVCVCVKFMRIYVRAYVCVYLRIYSPNNANCRSSDPYVGR